MNEVPSTAELASRPGRPPALERESRALAALARDLANSRRNITQRLVQLARELCQADTAGICLLQDPGSEEPFHWEALAGAEPARLRYRAGKQFGPARLAIERRQPELFRHQTDACESLLVPILFDGR